MDKYLIEENVSQDTRQIEIKESINGQRMPDSLTTMNLINILVCPTVGRGDKKIGSRSFYTKPEFYETYRSIPHSIPLIPYTYDSAAYQNISKYYCGKLSDATSKQMIPQMGNEVGRDILRQLERVHDNFMSDLWEIFSSEIQGTIDELEIFFEKPVPSAEENRRVRALLAREKGEVDDFFAKNEALRQSALVDDEFRYMRKLQEKQIHRRFFFDFLKSIRFTPFCFFTSKESRSKLDTVYFYYEISKVIQEKGQIGTFATETARRETIPRIMIFSLQNPDAILDWLNEFPDVTVSPRIFKTMILQIVNTVAELFYGMLPTFERKYPLLKPVSVPVLSVSVQQNILRDLDYYKSGRLDQITLKIRDTWRTGLKQCYKGGKLTNLKGKWNSVHWMRSERALISISNMKYSYGLFVSFKKSFEQFNMETRLFSSLLLTNLVWNCMRCTADVSFKRGGVNRPDDKLIFEITDIYDIDFIYRNTLFHSDLVQWVLCNADSASNFTASLKQVDHRKSPIVFFAFEGKTPTLTSKQCGRLREKSSITVIINAKVPQSQELVIPIPFYQLKKNFSFLCDASLWYHIQDLACQKLNAGWLAEMSRCLKEGNMSYTSAPSYHAMLPYEKMTTEAYKSSGLRGKFSVTVKPFLSAACFYDHFEDKSNGMFERQLQDTLRDILAVDHRVVEWATISNRFIIYLSTLLFVNSFDAWLKQSGYGANTHNVQWKDRKYLYLPYETFWEDFITKNKDLPVTGEKEFRRKFVQEILPKINDMVVFASQKNGKFPRADFRKKDLEGNTYSFLRLRIDVLGRIGYFG